MHDTIQKPQIKHTFSKYNPDEKGLAWAEAESLKTDRCKSWSRRKVERNRMPGVKTGQRTGKNISHRQNEAIYLLLYVIIFSLFGLTTCLMKKIVWLREDQPHFILIIDCSVNTNDTRCMFKYLQVSGSTIGD